MAESMTTRYVNRDGHKVAARRPAMPDLQLLKDDGMGSQASQPTVTPVLVAELLAAGDRMPVYVHVIDHPEARGELDDALSEDD